MPYGIELNSVFLGGLVNCSGFFYLDVVGQKKINEKIKKRDGIEERNKKDINIYVYAHKSLVYKYIEEREKRRLTS